MADISYPHKGQQRANYATLCRLFLEVGTLALRETFNKLYPPLLLVDKLAKPDIHKALRRFKYYGVITQSQWLALYPRHKELATSETYDATLLLTLLTHVCHLSPPYPNGWRKMPKATDHSLSAHIAHFQCIQAYLGSVTHVDQKNFTTYWNTISELLKDLGGATCAVWIKRLRIANLTLDEEKRYIDLVQQWNKLENLVRENEANMYKIKTRHHNDVAKLCSGTLPTIDGAIHKVNGANSPRQWTRHQRDSHKYATQANSSEMSIEQRDVINRFYSTITARILPDDITPRLCHHNIMTSSEIKTISMNQNRADKMRCLLDFLVTKTTRAYMVFLEAIREKYSDIYEAMQKTRFDLMNTGKLSNMTIVDKAEKALRCYYSRVYSKHRPIQWQGNTTRLGDFYCQLAVLDNSGVSIGIDHLLGNIRTKQHHSRRILIHGDSGCGKSTSSHYLVQQWADNNMIDTPFKLVFHMDLKLIGNMLHPAVVEPLSHSTLNLEADDIWSLIEANQNEALLVIDGADHLQTRQQDALTDLFTGDWLKHTHLIMFANLKHIDTDFAKQFDVQYQCMGFNGTKEIRKFVRKYTEITKAPEINMKPLEEYLNNTDPTDSMQILMKTPGYALCVCTACDVGMEPNFHAKTAILKNFLIALKSQFCKQNLAENSSKLKMKASTTLHHLRQLALQGAKSQKSRFHLEFLDKEYNNPMMNEIGLISKVKIMIKEDQEGEIVTFCNRFIQDYLTALCIVNEPSVDETEYHIRLLDDPKWIDICSFYFGLKNSSSDEIAIELMEDMATKYSNDTTDKDGHVKKTTKAQPRQEPVENHLDEFMRPLECLNECEGRMAVVKCLTTALPECIAINGKNVISQSAILGFSHALSTSKSKVTQLTLTLDSHATYRSNVYIKLAHAIRSNGSITTLILKWSSPDLLATFISQIFPGNTTITHIACTDESKMADAQLSGTLWSNIRSSCQGMSRVQYLGFTHCKNPNLINNVLRNIPNETRTLELSHCTFNVVTAEEVAIKLERNQHLKVLDLSHVPLNSTFLSALTRGIRINSTIRDINLGHCDLDMTGLMVLTEALKFNNGLRSLDIRNTVLTNEGCKLLVKAVQVNKTIKQVCLTGCKIATEGKWMLETFRKDGFQLLGLSGNKLRFP
ncbi:unnamed protein product [Owenia fusiformis]|uniref:NACHT domain-containing protein n=1 Tax=Owenia fusiformis TaxID=6347 RepID=A0A8S4NBC3_OWEFU|nr:unnamed protein product [Owenia fusiformis]